MTRIESPTSREHLLRLTVLLLLCVAVAAWSVYDALVKYPRQNLREVVAKFDPVPSTRQMEDLARRINRSIGPKTRRLVSAGAELASVEAQLGPPHYVDRMGQGAYRYLGPAGVLTVNRLGPRVTSVDWNNGKHTPADITWQWVFAGAGGVLGILFLTRLAAARRIRVVLDESGLTPASRQTIAWDQMRELRADHYRAKGWVDLHYTDGGLPKTVRLDSYRIRDFRPLVTALCERKGFPTPFDSLPAGPSAGVSASSSSSGASGNGP